MGAEHFSFTLQLAAHPVSFATSLGLSLIWSSRRREVVTHGLNDGCL